MVYNDNMSYATNKFKILIVDDSKTVHAVTKVYLEGMPVECIKADDGFSALPLVIREQPGLIFLDVIMPKLNGYNLCSMIKNNPQCSHIPVIMLSSRDSVFDKAKGKISGCDGYLTKPIVQSELVDLANKYMKEERGHKT